MDMIEGIAPHLWSVEERQMVSMLAKRFGAMWAWTEDACLQALESQPTSVCLAPIWLTRLDLRHWKYVFPKVDLYVVRWVRFAFDQQGHLERIPYRNEAVAWYEGATYEPNDFHQLFKIHYADRKPPREVDIFRAFLLLATYGVLQEELILTSCTASYRGMMRVMHVTTSLPTSSLSLQWHVLFKEEELALVLPLSELSLLPPLPGLADVITDYQILRVPDTVAERVMELLRGPDQAFALPPYRLTLKDWLEALEREALPLCIVPTSCDNVRRPEWEHLLPEVAFCEVIFAILVDSTPAGPDHIVVVASYQEKYYDARLFDQLLEDNGIVITEDNLELVARAVALMTAYEASKVRFAGWQKEGALDGNTECSLTAQVDNGEVRLEWFITFESARLKRIAKPAPRYSREGAEKRGNIRNFIGEPSFTHDF